MNSKLTAREQEVLLCLAAGLTNRQIAARLVVSCATVKTHVDHIRRKLGVRTRQDAVLEARARGYFV